MYRFLNKGEYKPIGKACWLLIRHMQELLKSKYSIDVLMVGSINCKLPTINLKTSTFEFDFIFLFNKNKEYDNLSNPKEIIDDIVFTFEQIKKEKNNPYKVKGIEHTHNGLIIKLFSPFKNQYQKYNFNMNILIKKDYGRSVINYNKANNSCNWINQEGRTDLYWYDRFRIDVRKKELTPSFKTQYLKLKNACLNKNINVDSFDVFKQSINLLTRKK